LTDLGVNISNVTAEIHLIDLYRSPNIGIFLRTNDSYTLVPRGLAPTKSEKIASILKCPVIQTSIAGSRLLGPLLVMNNNGILVSRIADDEEVESLRSSTGIRVEKLNSRFTSVGNLISANDNGAVASDVFSDENTKVIEQTLNVPVKRMRISTYVQIGSMISATNDGAIVHPMASEAELDEVRRVLRVDPEAATVNGGVPFVGSGFAGNAKGILLGNQTRGGELVIIGRAFSPG
jgi:translation initiation factor 6